MPPHKQPKKLDWQQGGTINYKANQLMTEQNSSLLTGLVCWWQQEKRRNGTSNSTDHHQHLQQQRRAPANHPENNSNGEQTTSTKLGNISRADGTATLVVWPFKIRQTRVKVLAFQLPYSITEHQYNNEQVQGISFLLRIRLPSTDRLVHECNTTILTLPLPLPKKTDRVDAHRRRLR